MVEPPPIGSKSRALSTSEIELIRSVMSQLDTSASALSSFVHSDNFARLGNSQLVSAFMSHSTLPWIIDSGASDHMTSQSNLFSSYIPCISPDKVKIIDGTFLPVSEKGLVHTTPSLSLSFVLQVLSFAANLLSISRITRDLNCSVTFFPSCVFQDLQTRTTIGSGRETNGLYFLDLPAPTQGQLSVAHHLHLSIC